MLLIPIFLKPNGKVSSFSTNHGNCDECISNRKQRKNLTSNKVIFQCTLNGSQLQSDGEIRIVYKPNKKAD